jgi:hypothetical protein
VEEGRGGKTRKENKKEGMKGVRKRSLERLENKIMKTRELELQ